MDIRDKADFKSKTGKHSEEYFPELFGTIEDHAGELRKWLLEYPITDHFKKTRDAPMTEYKGSMIGTEEASHPGLHETMDVIKEGGQFFSDNVVSRSDLFSEVRFTHPELGLKPREETIILKKLGYMGGHDVVQIYGKTKRFWTKQPMTNDEIRDDLRKTGV